jgi:hypothetical protein
MSNSKPPKMKNLKLGSSLAEVGKTMKAGKATGVRDVSLTNFHSSCS